MVNIVKNPSFEIDTNGDGVPDDWETQIWFGVEPYDIKFSLDTDAVHGVLSALITYNAISSGEPQATFAQLLDVTKIKAGEPIKLSVKYKTLLSYCIAYVQFFDADWKIISSISVPLSQNDGTWRLATITGTAPLNFAYAYLYLNSTCSATRPLPATIRFDDVAVEVEIPPPPRPPIAPLLQGWGGIRLIETTRYTNVENDSPRTTPTSIVFIGEVASNAELTCLEMKKSRYNAVRAYWEPPTTQQSPEWGYDDAWMQRFIEIAKALDMWIIVDCHGYRDHYLYEEAWLSHWQHVISTFKDSYAQIVWQPQNEPVMETGNAQTDVQELGRIYQRWIDMCRGLGDTHWIIVSGKCWSSPLAFPDWFPTVTDSLDKVFLDYHFYYFHEWEAVWTVEGAEASADRWINQIKAVIAKHGRPFICTEISATPYSPGHEYEQVPTAQYGGAAGYSTISLAFVKRLITHFHTEGIDYLLWEASDWGKNWSPGWHYGGLYGGMDVWGQYLPLPTPTPPIIPIWVVPVALLGSLLGAGVLYLAAKKK